MTFSWAKILMILIVVGLSTSFLATNHTLISAQLNYSAAPTCTSSSATAIDNCVIAYHQSNQSDVNHPHLIVDSTDSVINGEITANYPSTIIGTSLFYLVDIASVNTQSTKLPISNDIHYVPTYSARYINLAQHHSDEIKPSYLLAYEFISPPVPSLAIGYQIDFSPQLDWTLSTVSAPSRLSGWKESNLLFVHTHIC